MRRLRRILQGVVPRYSLRTISLLLLAATGCVGFWHAWNGKCPWAVEAVLEHSDWAPYFAAFRRDGRIEVWTDRGKHVWDGRTGELVEWFQGQEKWFPRDSAVAPNLLSPGAAVRADGVAVIDDGYTGKVRHVLTGHSRPVYLVRFSRDGSRLVTASRDLTGRVWDVSTGECVSPIAGDGEGFILSADFSPDGRRLATAGSDGRVTVWDAATGSRLAWLSADLGPMHAVQYAFPEPFWRGPVGGASAFERFEHVDSRAYRLVLPETLADMRLLDNAVCIHSARFSADGRRIVAARPDGTAVVWRRERPEWWWGVCFLWEFWVAAALCGAFFQSLISDHRRLSRRMTA